MHLRDLEYLVAVADRRHFSEAAAACGVSQSTLSTQLRKLEAELGVELVERTPRRVGLTPTGAMVVERARAALAAVAEIGTIAASAADPRAGSLRLGVFPTLGPYLLPRVVPRLRSAFPRLELLLVEEKTAVLVEQLRTGQLDAAVMARPVRDPLLDEVPLFREVFDLAVPAGHPLCRAPRPVPLSALAGESVLLLDEGHCLRDQALAFCSQAGAGERGFRATSLETLRSMVAAGSGCTLLPRMAVAPPAPDTAGMVLLPIADPVPHRDVALFWRRGSARRQMLPEVARVIAALPAGLVERLRA